MASLMESLMADTLEEADSLEDQLDPSVVVDSLVVALLDALEEVDSLVAQLVTSEELAVDISEKFMMDVG